MHKEKQLQLRPEEVMKKVLAATLALLALLSFSILASTRDTPIYYETFVEQNSTIVAVHCLNCRHEIRDTLYTHDGMVAEYPIRVILGGTNGGGADSVRAVTNGIIAYYGTRQRSCDIGTMGRFFADAMKPPGAIKRTEAQNKRTTVVQGFLGLDEPGEPLVIHESWY